MRRVRLFPVLALGAACGAAGARPRPPEAGHPVSADTTTSTNANADLVVTVRLGADTAGSRRPLLITVGVRNAGAAARELATRSGCLTDYELVDADGRVVGRSGQVCTQMLTARPIAPGETIEELHNWVPGLPGTPDPAPGRYAVRGVLLLRDGPVRSAPAPVRVVPR